MVQGGRSPLAPCVTKPNADKVGACALPPSALAAPSTSGVAPVRVWCMSERTLVVSRCQSRYTEHLRHESLLMNHSCCASPLTTRRGRSPPECVIKHHRTNGAASVALFLCRSRLWVKAATSRQQPLQDMYVRPSHHPHIRNNCVRYQSWLVMPLLTI
jgi:hypothetical protein